MPTFEGLRIEVQKLGAHLHAPGFEEYESSKCVAKGSGVSLHRLLRLPTEVQLQILVSIDMTFQWKGANALRIQIDFDEGHEVKDAEIVVMRPVRLGPINAQSLTSTPNGDEHTQLSQIARPIQPFTRDLDSGLVEIVDEEMVSFQTIEPQSTTGPPASLHGGGVIRIAVYTCLLEHSGRQQASLGGSGVEKLRIEKLSTRSPLLCHSKIKLFDRVQQASVSGNYRSKKANLAGSFIFHYHVPEDFDKLKGSDEEGHCIEDAGPGKRRVVPHSPKLTESSSSNRTMSPRQNPEPVTTSEQPRLPSVLQDTPFSLDEDTTLEQPPSVNQDRAADQEEETIVVLTNNGDLDTMDVDMPESPESPESTNGSVTDSQPDANCMDIQTDLEGLKDRNYTVTELEFLIDREEELIAERENNRSRINDECCAVFARINDIRGEEVRFEAEWSEKIESTEKERKKVKISVARVAARNIELEQKLVEDQEQETQMLEKHDELIKQVKANSARVAARSIEMEQELAEHQEYERQVKEKCDELARKAVERAAATRPQREHENRLLKKVEETKQQRLSAVRGWDSSTTE